MAIDEIETEIANELETPVESAKEILNEPGKPVESEKKILREPGKPVENEKKILSGLGKQAENLERRPREGRRHLSPKKRKRSKVLELLDA